MNFSGKSSKTQNSLIDGDEKVCEIGFQIERAARPVLRCAPNLRFETLRRVERAATLDAGAAIRDERRLDARRDVVVEQVVHDAIAEVGGPYLARFRARDDETDRAAGRIAAAAQLVVQLDQVALAIDFEGER